MPDRNRHRAMIDLRPTRMNLLNLAGIAVALYLVAILGGTIKRNYDLNRQIGELHGQIDLLKNQRDALQYGIAYYKTDSFKEREARAKLGLQDPGEGVVILPPRASAAAPVTDTARPAVKPRSNFRQWTDFLAGRG